MEEAVIVFKDKVIEILIKTVEHLEILLQYITDDSIVFAINNNFSPDYYVGGLLF